MTRRDAIKRLGLGAGVLAGGSFLRPLLAAESAGGQTDNRPNPPRRVNIIVMMVDDMGYSDLGCYGGEIQTPNLDALAAGGVRFTRFYNTSRCCPSRACILTGLYPHQTGLGQFEGAPAGPIDDYPGYQGAMVRPHVNMGEVMGAGGYATAHVGKWHVSGTPVAFDFQASLAGGYLETYFDKNFGPTCYNTDWLGDKMIEHIEASHAAGKPFFAYWAPFAPHWPIDAKTDDMKKYDGVYEAGPKAVAEARVAKMRQLGILPKEMPWEPPLVIDDLRDLDSVPKNSPQYQAIRNQHKNREADLGYRARIMTEIEFRGEYTPAPGEKMRGKARAAKSLAEGMRGYAAQVDCMDQNVGKVVAKLKELGIFDNTLILFCSDNGASNESHWGTSYSTGNLFAQVSNTPFREYKKHSFDGGVGTPLIMSWPAQIAPAARGTINHDTVGHLVDILPTIMAASGARYPERDAKGRAVPPLEGRSLLPALQGKQVPLNQPVFIEHTGNCALITQDWKLVADDGGKEGPWSLYDMKTDRCEITDVAAQHPDVVKQLDAQWQAIATRIGAKRTGKPKSKRKK